MLRKKAVEKPWMRRDATDGGSPEADAAAAASLRPGDRSFRNKYGFVAAIILTILLLIQMIPASRSFGAAGGVIDARDLPSGQDLLRLRGEWELYWGRLLRPSDFDGRSPPKPDAAIWLPSAWPRSRLNSRPLHAVGDATFRLKVRHGWEGRELGIKIMRINCAFELYADSKLLAKGGSLSDSPGGFSGGYAPQSVFFTPSSGETVILLRVSNGLPGAWSGPVEEIIMGPRKAIEGEAGGSLIADAFNASGRLFLALIFLALFLLLGSRLAGTFSVAILVMMLHVATAREMVLARLFPAMSFGLFVKIYIFATIGLLPFLLFTFEAFLRESRRDDCRGSQEGRESPAVARSRNWILIGAASTCVALALYLCLSGSSIFLRNFALFIPPTLLLFVYYSILVFHDAAKRRVGPAQFGIFLLFFFYTGYEILSMLRVVDQAYIYPFFFLKGAPILGGLATAQLRQGLVSYLNIAAIGLYFAYDILSRRFRKADAEALSGRLASASKAIAPGLSQSERERLVLGDPREIALIKARVEKAIGDPAILGKSDLDIRSLAAIVKIPAYRLSIWFNSHLETSFSSWLNARRIERAQRLMLDHPDRTIIEIAMEAGYASKSVFNDQFRRIVGMSPSDWRLSAARSPDPLAPRAPDT
jgi:AraC-like DNA-binding protein